MWISNAFAQASAAGADSNNLMSFLPLILMFAVLYFIMIRPQMRRQKETKAMLEALTVGDEVVTVGGIVGKVSALKDQFVTVEIAAGTEVQMQKAAITTVLPKGTLKSA
ncbi:preprotein translocase subunit YajC [Polynucleobacter sphagniphilus]|jgi:preprotein translocase subunit YajC|uniref:Sec translocon accessory complex subunit YajC n=1 Tax=Polynucleobacter sphagniphilus TaxID=1743169 RepID=A0AA43M8B7_9BURK|nr:preprotein translocase subunit YajC [Polynucleobacter sphagniphilus]MDF9788687.1 preprotein translocase subunit YajC [Polynucleobacter sphagniphilus]MDH6155286.1 preprotein translocase subunit YajC [Polynucleobacter sphagniphilus]MDH6241855.1 preprotein translocase subunit YajC [Polynucleobacter sphagniphilus]MDH6300164.1 preprotein translocase subunit YajC [Polynucleobacter sphagniphilus]MDH6302735.1 preprotein translocase subunit YajC [Polynucleobacter sphagniphilus]